MRHDSVERNVVTIGVAGALLFFALVSVLAFSQVRFDGVLEDLTGTVVPVQASLGQVLGTVGALTERQARIASSSNQAELEAVGSRATDEQALREAKQVLLTALERERGRARFPGDAMAGLSAHVDAFLEADAALSATTARRHALQARFEAQVAAGESGLRDVTQQAAGMTGVLRLEAIVQLRGLVATPGEAQVRTYVLGDTRAQLDAMLQLESSVLGLGGLAGKIGLARTDDAINSIVANEFTQTRNAVLHRLDEVLALVGTRADVGPRARTLQEGCATLLAMLGEETNPQSLVSLRRQVLAEGRAASTTRAHAAQTASLLTQNVAQLRDYAASLADDSSASALSTSRTGRAVSLVVSVVGLLVCGVAGLRIRRAVQSLRAQNVKLEKMSAELATLNEGLEKQVAARTLALSHRERAMQLVLDSMTEGLATVELGGALLPERSRALTATFGEAHDGQLLWDYLWPNEPRQQEAFQVGFEQLTSDIFPFEVAVDQVPRGVKRGERYFELDFRQVFEEGRFARILVIVRDVTAALRAGQHEREARETQRLISHLLKDKLGFARMVNDTTADLQRLRDGDLAAQKRLLHTLKGNAGVYGFAAFAQAVHDLESRLEDGGDVSAAEQEALQVAWQAALKRIEEFVAVDPRAHVELKRQDLDDLVDFVRRRPDWDEVVRIVESWRDDPVAAAFHRLGAQARRYALQLGKRLEVTEEDNRVRLPEEKFKRFWAACVHLVRNTADHGAELPEVRAALGKQPATTLRLWCRQGAGEITIGFEDDGAGVNWEAVRRAAVQKGLPTETQADLIRAVFSDGVSSRTEVTELSGRGVGMGAVSEAVEALGGRYELASEPGRGTTFLFHFPTERLARVA